MATDYFLDQKALPRSEEAAQDAGAGLPEGAVAARHLQGGKGAMTVGLTAFVRNLEWMPTEVLFI